MKKISAIFVLFTMLLTSCAGAKAPETTESTEQITEATTEAPIPDPVLSDFYQMNAAHKEGSHTDLTDYSYLEADFRTRNELSPSVAKTSLPYYTRVKQLPDGTFLLFYNDEKNGQGVRCLKSENGKTWGSYSTVFSPFSDKVYANPDAIVLNNGDILVCAAWRHKGSYYTNPTRGGISIKRSTDNGKTWGQEQVIFTGINWEPSFLQLRSGELHIYWTNTTCHVLPSGNNTSTGTAMLRSFDNGKTWTGDISTPYSGQVVSKQKTEYYDGVQFYTDQMPVAVELQNGTIALAMESRLNRNNTYRVTMAYSNDNWAETVPANGEGPKDKLTNHFVATAPYIRQFPSGEVILRYSRLETSTLLLADPTGHKFHKELVKLDNTNHWGSIELIDNMHTALAVSTSKYDVDTPNELRKITTQKVNLDHALFAPGADSIEIDGNSHDWTNNTDALFVGSASQAQATYRFAKNGDKVYLLIDRLDYDLTDEDTCTVQFSLPGSILDVLSVTVGINGITEQFARISGVKQDISCNAEVTVFGTANDGKAKDEGFLAEIEIPASFFGDEIRVSPTLYNKDTDGKGIADSIEMISATNTTRWIPVKFGVAD